MEIKEYGRLSSRIRSSSARNQFARPYRFAHLAGNSHRSARSLLFPVQWTLFFMEQSPYLQHIRQQSSALLLELCKPVLYLIAYDSIHSLPNRNIYMVKSLPNSLQKFFKISSISAPKPAYRRRRFVNFECRMYYVFLNHGVDIY